MQPEMILAWAEVYRTTEDRITREILQRDFRQMLDAEATYRDTENRLTEFLFVQWRINKEKP
jgi:hypothetical protein